MKDYNIQLGPTMVDQTHEVFFARATEAGTKVGVFESKKYFFSDQWISDSIEGPILISKLVANKPFFRTTVAIGHCVFLFITQPIE